MMEDNFRTMAQSPELLLNMHSWKTNADDIKQSLKYFILYQNKFHNCIGEIALTIKKLLEKNTLSRVSHVKKF